MRPTSFLALFIAALAATNAQAGRLSGTVIAPDGRPLAQLPIRVIGDRGARTVITTVGGHYVVDDLAAGAYRIESGVPGFVVGARAEATVGQADTRLDVTLTAAPLREQVLVAATRSEAAASTVGVTASVLDRERIEAREASSLAVLLQELPGVTIARTGPLGQQGSAFVRGGESRFARIMIDGIPLNEPGGAYNLGALLPFELERVELVRGAASSLYGTDALAGVIQLVTKRAAAGEAPAVFVEAQGGDFDWRSLRGGTSGRSGRLDWNAAVLRLETDNEVPNSAFEATAGAASLGATLTERLSLRAFFRGEDSHTGTPGPTAFGPADLEEFTDRTDLAGAVSLRYVGPQVTHELQMGTARSDQLTADPVDSGSFVPEWEGQQAAFPRSDFVNDGFRNDTRRSFAGYRLEASLGGRHLVSVGADVEHETGELGTSFELLTPERTNVGAYVQDRLVLGRSVFVTAGAASSTTRASAPRWCPARPWPGACAAAPTPRSSRRAADSASRSRVSSNPSVCRRSRAAIPTSSRSAAAPPTWASSSTCSTIACASRPRSSITTTAIRSRISSSIPRRSRAPTSTSAAHAPAGSSSPRRRRRAPGSA